ncbi:MULTISPECIES: MFS transporter [unclassified Nocardia]|uniref:MFS transporter n=1 Tax=unclassified Nocardia TaxID=2637762 RepID=UPI001CE416EF|nr:MULTISPECIES: MFS transporter [unclassified Nocardia]
MKPDYRLLAVMYVSQYLGLSFFTDGLVAILRDRGASLEQIGTFETLGLIWVAKPLWATFVDRIGTYRGWLLVLQPTLAAVLLLAIPLDPVRDLGVLAAVVAVVAFLSASHDIATDAIAVRMLAENQRGIGSGIQTAGGYLGGILGGGLTLLVYDHFGWSAAIVTLAVTTVLPLLQIARFREPAALPAVHRPSVRAVLRRPGALRWMLLVMPPCIIGLYGGYALITPMLVDLGWSVTSVGLTTNALGGLVGIGFGIGVGLLAARFRRRAVLVAAACAQVLALVLMASAWFTGSSVAVLVAAMTVQAAMAATMTIVFTIAIDRAEKTSAGTDFTVVASFLMLLGTIGGALLTTIAGAVGYVTALTGAAVVAVVGAVGAARNFQESSSDVVAEPVVVRQA